jgi:hypothetical protein
MDFRVLGPVGALGEDGLPRPVRAAKERALLAALLLHANHVVPVDQLVEALWEREPPDGAPATLQAYVSRLRRALGPVEAARLETCPPGYRLRVGPGSWTPRASRSWRGRAVRAWAAGTRPARGSASEPRWRSGGGRRWRRSPTPNSRAGRRCA